MEAAFGADYPAALDVDTPERMARWRPFVQLILALPHFIVLYALGILSGVVALVSWFVVLFTGKLPTGLAGVQVMYLRYSNRVTAYAGFLLEGYPPFTFGTEDQDPGEYTGERVDFTPQLEDRNRVTTFFRYILAIPHFIALFFVGIAASVAWIVGAFAVLFTGSWPEGLRRFVVGSMRWTLRVNAYTVLLTDKYPPFSLD